MSKTFYAAILFILFFSVQILSTSENTSIVLISKQQAMEPLNNNAAVRAADEQIKTGTKIYQRIKLISSTSVPFEFNEFQIIPENLIKINSFFGRSVIISWKWFNPGLSGIGLSKDSTICSTIFKIGNTVLGSDTIIHENAFLNRSGRQTASCFARDFFISFSI